MYLSLSSIDGSANPGSADNFLLWANQLIYISVSSTLKNEETPTFSTEVLHEWFYKNVNGMQHYWIF